MIYLNLGLIVLNTAVAAVLFTTDSKQWGYANAVSAVINTAAVASALAF